MLLAITRARALDGRSSSSQHFFHNLLSKNYAKISRIAKNELFMSFSP